MYIARRSLLGAAGLAWPYFLLRSGAQAAARRAVTFGNYSGLRRALESVRPGDEIILDDGVYDGPTLTLTAVGSREAPITIRGASPLGPRLRFPIVVAGTARWWTLSGLTFTDATAPVILGGDDNRVLRCRFTRWQGIGLQLWLGNRCEVGWCVFEDPLPWTAAELATSGTQLRMGIRYGNKGSVHPMRPYIHHCGFYRFIGKPRPSVYHSGQSDAISLGTASGDGNLSTYARVEKILIVDHPGNEQAGGAVFDIKTSNASVRDVTIRNAPKGRLDNRNGSRSRFENIWLDAAGGMVIRGGFHTLVGIRSRGGRIDLASGDVEWSLASNRFPRVWSAKLAWFDTDVTVGTKQYPLPAQGCRLEARVAGRVTLGKFQSGTIQSPSSSEARITPSPVTEAMVGPQVPAA